MKKMNEKKKKTGLLRLLEIAGRKKWWLFGSMVLGIIATIALFVPFIAIYLIIIELAGNGTDLAAIDQSYVYRLGFISLGAVGAFGVFLYASVILSHIAAFNILYEIRIKLADKLSRLPMGYFTKKTTGEIKKVMSEDVERLEVFIAHHIPDVTSAIVFPLLLIIYLFIVDWRLALAALVPFPIAIAFQVIMFASPAMKERYKQYHDALEKMNATVIEYVRGMPVVKVFNQSVDAFVRLKKDIFTYRDFTKGITKQFSTTYPGFLTIISSSLFFIIPVATFLLTRSPSYEDFIPKVFLFMVLGGGMFFPLFKLMWIGGFLREASIGVDRIDNILLSPEIPEPNKSRMPRDASSIEFKNVTFAYDDTPVLKDISFTSKPNTITALVGPSGAGKTTIGLLIARFWDIHKGKIKVGGVGIDEIRTEDLMDHVSFVFQDGFMFFDTIEENIRMGNKTASKEAVITAAKAAHCHEFIKILPQGYKTLVGEGGTYLSGGEQQRIALARAILKDSPIVVLDEATAYADPENEAKILASFAELTKGKTVIVIAHRLSTITNADQILVIDKGTVVERGKHDELISKKGLYLRMWEAYSRSRDWTIDVKGGST
jgi:ATP-binding cassette subfamily B protein